LHEQTSKYLLKARKLKLLSLLSERLKFRNMHSYSCAFEAWFLCWLYTSHSVLHFQSNNVYNRSENICKTFRKGNLIDKMLCVIKIKNVQPYISQINITNNLYMVYLNILFLKESRARPVFYLSAYLSNLELAFDVMVFVLRFEIMLLCCTSLFCIRYLYIRI